jgi:ribosomal protein S18 acetylase RimI-like enzyme
MDLPDLVIRRAVASDLTVLGRLGASLMRQHHAYDSRRFMAPGDRPEDGYAWFLGTQLEHDDVAIFVAEQNAAVVGYTYIGLEPQSWKELRDACGYVHDIVVETGGQRHGAGAALMEAAFAWLRERKAPRVVLWTSPHNENAQRLFDHLGFRRTMIEMTRELEDGQ